MVNTNPDHPAGHPMNPDATQGDISNTNAIHKAKPPFSRSITMGGTTPVAQEKKGESHTIDSSPIPFDASGSPKTTPPPVVVPRIRRRITPIDEETAVQQHGQEDSRSPPESLTSRKDLTDKNQGGLTLSTASTVVEDAPRESSVIHHVAHDGPSASAGSSSEDPLKTPTKSSASANPEPVQLPLRQAKIITEEPEETKKETSKLPQESTNLPEEADKQPQDANTPTGATPLPTDLSGPAPLPTDASDSPETITTLRTQLARLHAANDHLRTALVNTHLHNSELRHEARLSERVAKRTHTLGQRAHNRAAKLETLYARARAERRAAITLGKTWKTRAEAAEQEREGLLERNEEREELRAAREEEVGALRVAKEEAEREVAALKKWREKAQVEGEGWWERAMKAEAEVEEFKAWEEGAREEAQGMLARAEKAEGEVRVERERARKYWRKYEDLKIANEEKKKKEKEGQGQGQQGQGQVQVQVQVQGQGQNQQSGGSVAAVAEKVVGRINSALEEILEDVYGKDVAKEKMALAGMLEQDPVIFEPLELAMNDKKDMEEREKELDVFFKYVHLRAEFAKNAGMDATQEQFDRAMKMEARAREEVRCLGRPRTKSF